MSCEHPNGVAYTKDGNTKFMPHEEYLAFENIKQLSDLRYHAMLKRNGFTKVVPVGCGTCKGCQLQKSKEWANRICMELESYPEEECWFITLTYDDEHINWAEGQKQEYMPGYGILGVEIEEQTLNKTEFSNFIKKLRAYWEYHYNVKGIRFFACGEYGGKTKRPHYHLIVFGMPMVCNDLEQWGASELGYKRLTSKTISEIWGKGFVDIGKVTWESAAYVARYTLKKAYGKDAKKWESEHVKEREFIDMSRMPGIGRKYYEEHKEDMYKFDEAWIRKGLTGATVKIPAYFDRLFDVEDPEKLEAIKETRQKVAEAKQAEAMKHTDLSIQEQREVNARALDKRTKKLKDNKI